MVTGGSRGVSFEVEASVDGCMGEKAWVCAGRLEEVEIDHGLGNDVIPICGGKVRVAIGESGAKIIFECVDRMFGGIVAVGVRGNKLEVNVVFE